MNKKALLMFTAIAAAIVVVEGILAVVVPAQAQQFQNIQTNNQQACTRDCYNNQNVQGNNDQGACLERCAGNVNNQGNFDFGQ
jgi:uncharacterized membrane protein